MQKPSEPKIRKLPLPLEIRLGTDTVVSDGLFSLTSKEASQIRIMSVDQDGYASCEISPPVDTELKNMTKLLDECSDAFLIGTSSPKTLGRGKDFGQYRYYKLSDGSFVARISGKRNRKFQLGKMTDRGSPIWAIGRTILASFKSAEFSKKELTPLLSKKLQYGQILKATLDIMRLQGYLGHSENVQRGRIKETFKATDKLAQAVVPIPEQT